MEQALEEQLRHRFENDAEYRDGVLEQLGQAAWPQVLASLSLGGGGTEVQSEQLDDLDLESVSLLRVDEVEDDGIQVTLVASGTAKAAFLIDSGFSGAYSEEDPSFEVQVEEAAEGMDQGSVERQVEIHVTAFADHELELSDLEVTHIELTGANAT